MAQYNIIYTSATREPHLWNGSGFDKLSSPGRENLLYSGKPVNDDNLAQTLQQCRDVLKSTFADGTANNLKAVEIGVMTNKKK